VAGTPAQIARGERLAHVCATCHSWDDRVVLAGSDPRSVLSVIELSQQSYRKMKQNLAWAVGYNVITVPLAAGVLAPIGFVLPMAVGALLMSVSTIVVAANAQLLRRLDLRPEASVRRFLAG